MTDSDTTLPYNPYAASTPGQIMMREQDQSYGLDFTKQYLPSFSYHHSTQNSSQLDNGTLGNDSTTDSVTMAYTFKALTTMCNLSRVKTDSTQLTDSTTTSDAQTTSTTTTTPTTATEYHYQGTTDNASLSLNFQPNDRITLGTSVAENTITALADGTTTSGGGNTLGVTAMYKPFKTVTLNAGLQTSKTDAATTSTGDTAPAQSVQNQSLGIAWQCSKSFSLTTNFSKNSSQGGDNSDCKTDTFSTNMRWTPREWAKFDGYWSEQSLVYLDTVGSSESYMLGMNTQLGPIRALGKSTIELGVQHLWGDTTTGVTTLE